MFYALNSFTLLLYLDEASGYHLDKDLVEPYQSNAMLKPLRIFLEVLDRAGVRKVKSLQVSMRHIHFSSADDYSICSNILDLVLSAFRAVACSIEGDKRFALRLKGYDIRSVDVTIDASRLSDSCGDGVAKARETMSRYSPVGSLKDWYAQRYDSVVKTLEHWQEVLAAREVAEAKLATLEGDDA